MACFALAAMGGKGLSCFAASADGRVRVAAIIHAEPVGVHAVETDCALASVNIEPQFVVRPGGHTRGFDRPDSSVLQAHLQQRDVVHLHGGAPA